MFVFHSHIYGQNTIQTTCSWCDNLKCCLSRPSRRAKFKGPTWGPPGTCWTQIHNANHMRQHGMFILNSSLKCTEDINNILFYCSELNLLRPRPNRRHFADDIFKCILENENGWISPRISLTFVSKVRINNIPALLQIMAWRRPGDKPLSEPMMIVYWRIYASFGLNGLIRRQVIGCVTKAGAWHNTI